MCIIPNRPRPRKPIHPAEADVADKLRELESALEGRMECEGDSECLIGSNVIQGMLGAVRGMVRVVSPAARPRRAAAKAG